ncbi:unnamed protein product [Phytomonas sp. EM1]|nr:unnamed protein product [Phytomonas sp. EM1]|eukprot:CCW64273.1 unnamed protein product [Phytomonas sp. isolate EM1]
MKPLLIFGLRGTLVERLHARNVPSGMPAPDLTVGLAKVWLRPHLLSTLLALQEHCRLAVWSSTTARNTRPLMSAVFNAYATDADPGIVTGSRVAKQLKAQSSEAAPGSTETVSRFRKRGGKASSGFQTDDVSASLEQSPKFEFIWSREHTSVDDFRRRNAVVNDDAYATVKDLSRVFQQFQEIAQPSNTVLIDDTPSKGKLHADNFLWLDTCEGLGIQDQQGMRQLHTFVMEKLLPAKDVRELLPARIRTGRVDSKI